MDMEKATFVAAVLRDNRGVNRNRLAAATQDRARVEGKFFARGTKRQRVHGVTYGPFSPNQGGEPFPAPERVEDDFALMQAAGINAVRTYHVPPDWFLDQADEHGLSAFVDIPWRQHLCFLDSR